MLRQLFAGILVSLGNVAIYAVVITAVIGAARAASRWHHGYPQLWLPVVMVATVGVLLGARIAEVITWAITYSFLDVAPPHADVLYFAFVNTTTLGYGDIVPNERWLLLGPMAAMNGVLLFGWSTAVNFEVLMQARRIRERSGER